MASKRRAPPMDQPPKADSSSSEEEETSSEEEESSSEEDNGTTKPPSTSQPLAAGKKSIAEKPQPAATVTKSQEKASSSESETESDSGSDSEDERPAVAADPVVTSTPPAKKTKSQPSEAPARSAAKRASENNQAVNDSKKAKKGKEAAGDGGTPAAVNGVKKAGEEPKKLFQRVWSVEDEIALLKGMAAFSSKTGANPHREIDSFHEFIKKSLHIDVSNEQLLSKIRRTKNKYEKMAAKIRKNGLGPRLTKPRDLEAFELSKKIWGTQGENGGTELIKSDEKVQKIQKKGKGSNTGPSLKPEAEQNDSVFTDQNLGPSPILSEMIRFDQNLGMSRLHEDTVRRGVELIGPSERAELDDRWKKLQIAELELLVKRADLVKHEATLILEAYKSSN